MSRNEILQQLISGKLIAPNVADALKNNSAFGGLLIDFSSKTRADCLVNGFCYEMVFDEQPNVIERYKMSEDLFIKHAENFQKQVSKTKYDIDYFEPEQEVLLKIPKLLAEYLEPLEWLESLSSLSDLELGSLLVAVGEMLFEDIRQYKAEDVLLEDDLADSSSWVEVIEKTLHTCRGFVQGEGITTDELDALLESEDVTDIVQLSAEIEDPEVILFLNYIYNIASYILTLAFYKEYGTGCALPEILDSFQGEGMSESFIKYMLNMVQDKLINKEKLDQLLLQTGIIKNTD